MPLRLGLAYQIKSAKTKPIYTSFLSIKAHILTLSVVMAEMFLSSLTKLSPCEEALVGRLR